MRHNQNRRPRGRNRKGPNPLTRSYESNGPDVKVRGTPAHIAEKYIALARDALSAGDTVSAENYHQHAEHYNRIVMAAQAQQAAQAQKDAGGRDGEAREGDDAEQSRGERGPDNRSNYRGNGRRNDRVENDGATETAEVAASTNGPAEADNKGLGEQPSVLKGNGADASPSVDDEAARPRRRRRRPDDSAAEADVSAQTDAPLSEADGGEGDAKPNGRRRRGAKPEQPVPDASQAAEGNDGASLESGEDKPTTSDGAAALTAFPD